MTEATEARHMTLSHSSHCGNPQCKKGTLEPGSNVLIVSKHIYCSPECVTAHLEAAPTRSGRKVGTSKKATAAAAAAAAAAEAEAAEADGAASVSP